MFLCGTQHRDLKLSNCMFEDKSDLPIVKVIDFGLCAELKDGKTSSAFVGTMTYAAPEVGKMVHVALDLTRRGIMHERIVSSLDKAASLVFLVVRHLCSSLTSSSC